MSNDNEWFATRERLTIGEHRGESHAQTDPPDHADRRCRAPVRVLRLTEVMNTVGLCRSAIYKLKIEGKFPKPVKVGLRAVRWVEHEIQDWLAQQMERRKPK